MAYSMFECPKLHNAKSLKFYPEEYDHHVAFRHKNLPPDFEMTMESYNTRIKNVPGMKTNFSLEAHSSTNSKCPIYVHNFSRVQHHEGDFVPKTKKKVKNKTVPMSKLEESYWANWKPEKNDMKKSNSRIAPPPMKTVRSSKSPEIQVIKSAPPRRRKIQVYPDPEESNLTLASRIEEEGKMKKISSKSQEIQTDETSLKPKIEEKQIVQENVNAPIEEKESVQENPQVIPSEDLVDEKFLRHTDSFILNVKKQAEEKEPIDQPKCIRLYKKPGKISSKNFVRGGSYPLRSCLKKESTLTKGSSKLGRPGSPIIVSSSFSTKSKKSHRH